MTFEELLKIPELNPVNDSRKIAPGCVFCAIKGAKADGARFIPDAIKAGAAMIVSENELPELTVPVIKVENSYKAWALLCESAAGFPALSMNFHGVTGTNGKTTIAYLLKHFFRENTGLITTVEYDTGNGIFPAAGTTPDAKEFQRIILEMKKNQIKNCVMELSSHGLHQYRTGSTKFKTAIFTNLTGDHLDYHLNMDSYFQAKKILFEELSEENKIINIDDPWGKKLQKECGGYSISLNDNKADFFACNISGSHLGTTFELNTPAGHFKIKSPLIGLHNVSNLTEAIAGAMTANVPVQKILNAMEKEFFVPGRLERINLPDGITAYVDYAHTDDALKRVLEALRPLCKGKIFCVFGCGGDRDKTKRKRMGMVAANTADYVIVTSDNPRTENPEAILQEICSGIPVSFPHEVIPDREFAIRKAAELANPDDLILVAGKGHENYQEINGIRHHFDDREILRKIK